MSNQFLFSSCFVKCGLNEKLLLIEMDLYFKDLIDRYNDNVINEGGNMYVIRVMGRRENLFFRENDKCLICDIDAVQGIVYKLSIKVWDSHNERMNTAEKARVTDLIIKFYKQVYNPDAQLK